MKQLLKLLEGSKGFNSEEALQLMKRIDDFCQKIKKSGKSHFAKTEEK